MNFEKLVFRCLCLEFIEVINLNNLENIYFFFPLNAERRMENHAFALNSPGRKILKTLETGFWMYAL